MHRLLIFFTCLLFALPCFAQSDENAPLIIGTKVAPPFVIKEEDGTFSGISIELWQRIAEEMGLQYEFRETTLSGLISGLQDGTLDVSVAALTVTAKREQQIDFTHPFHTTGLAIAVTRQESSVIDMFQRFFSWKFMLVIAALCGLLLLVGVFLWLAERHKNQAMFGGSPAEGIGSSFWWAAVTMTTVGYGDKAPITLAGRVVGLIWMFAGLIIVSSFTAAITTSLTVSQLDSRVRGLDDLPNVRVATVKNSVSAEFLRDNGIGFSPQPNLVTATEGLAKGQFQAVVYDRPILLHLSHQQYPKRTDVLAETFERQDYAIAVQQDSPLRGPLNLALLRVIANDDWQTVLTRYLGNDRH
jgi:ABC-type amino acid transport substrate-binding protein